MEPVRAITAVSLASLTLTLPTNIVATPRHMSMDPRNSRVNLVVSVSAWVELV